MCLHMCIRMCTRVYRHAHHRVHWAMMVTWQEASDRGATEMPDDRLGPIRMLSDGGWSRSQGAPHAAHAGSCGHFDDHLRQTMTIVNAHHDDHSAMATIDGERFDPARDAAAPAAWQPELPCHSRSGHHRRRPAFRPACAKVGFRWSGDAARSIELEARQDLDRHFLLNKRIEDRLDEVVEVIFLHEGLSRPGNTQIGCKHRP